VESWIGMKTIKFFNWSKILNEASTYRDPGRTCKQAGKNRLHPSQVD